jgi:ubiquinone/menaquinone biosynthesis C-methylase UbiE
MAAEFDRYGGTYEEAIAESIGFSRLEHSFFLEAKARRLLDLVRRRLGDPSTVRALDVGCGTGVFDALLAGKLGALEGADVSAAMVEEARSRNPGVEYHVADARTLPSADGDFDLVFAICVLHHVPPADRDAVASELRRVTRPGGLVVVMEHNRLNPLTRLAVARCRFDEDAVLLGRRETLRQLASAGLRPVESRYFLVLPWAGRFVAAVERVLAPVPLGAQYYVAAHA